MPPVSFFTEVIERLEEMGNRVILTSGPDPIEMQIATQIQKSCSKEVLSFAGQTSLKELASLIEMSKCLICVDSVPLHIASATKTPVVALFGPTSEQKWGPWMHPKAKVIFQNISCRPCYRDGCGGSKMSDCLYTLSPDRVIEAYQDINKNYFNLVSWIN